MPENVMPLLEVLHNASAKLRELADEAKLEIETCPGYETCTYPEYVLAAMDETEPRTPVARLATAMSPVLAIAVADWLDDEADILAKSWGDEEMGPDDREAYEIGYAAPLAVARAILSEAADA